MERKHIVSNSTFPKNNVCREYVIYIVKENLQQARVKHTRKTLFKSTIVWKRE